MNEDTKDKQPPEHSGSASRDCYAPRVHTMILFSNGQIAALDERGEQIQGLQTRSAIGLFADWAAVNGHEVVGCEVRTQLPGGEGPRCVIEGSIGEYCETWV
jgi:hypothetical protein